MDVASIPSPLLFVLLETGIDILNQSDGLSILLCTPMSFHYDLAYLPRSHSLEHAIQFPLLRVPPYTSFSALESWAYHHALCAPL